MEMELFIYVVIQRRRRGSINHNKSLTTLLLRYFCIFDQQSHNMPTTLSGSKTICKFPQELGQGQPIETTVKDCCRVY